MEETTILKKLIPTAQWKALPSGPEGGPGRGSGSASVMGVMDRGGDVIGLGAFQAALPDFLTHGVVTLGHDWGGLPIGMPEMAEEKGRNLETEWAYHSTKKAQDARTTAMERLAKNKSVGLSVGFAIDYELRTWFDSGESMWSFLEKMATPVLGFYDKDSITAYKSDCRLILGVKELFEYAQCSVPMNAMAVMTEAKRFGEAGLPAGQSLSAHLDSVLAAVEGATSRLASYKATRDIDNRPMSAERLAQAKTLALQLTELVDSAEKRLSGAPSPEDTALLDGLLKQRLTLISMTAS